MALCKSRLSHLPAVDSNSHFLSFLLSFLRSHSCHLFSGPHLCDFVLQTHSIFNSRFTARASYHLILSVLPAISFPPTDTVKFLAVHDHHLTAFKIPDSQSYTSSTGLPAISIVTNSETYAIQHSAFNSSLLGPKATPVSQAFLQSEFSQSLRPAPSRSPL